MEAAAKGPALPWAAPEKVTQQQEEEGVEAPRPGVPLSQVGLSQGSRIEVMWQVEAEGDQPYSRWWGATLESTAEAATTDHLGPTYQLKYDAYEDFEPEIRYVRFTSEHTLADEEQEDGEMYWRCEGDSFEPPDSDDESDDEMEERLAAVARAEGGLLTLRDLNELAGPPEGDDEILAGGTAYQQRVAADALRQFSDHLKDFMAARMEQKLAAGEDTVMTRDDANEFINLMKTMEQNKRS